MTSSKRSMGRLFLVACASALTLSACAVGPDYRAPAVATEAAFKEAADWTPITPMDALDRGQWWSAYHDPVLDDLERRVQVSNQTLAAQVAAYKQAQDALAVSQSTLVPAFSGAASGKKSGGDATGAQVGRMTAERWKAGYDQLKALGIVQTEFDPQSAYSLKFVE